MGCQGYIWGSPQPLDSNRASPAGPTPLDPTPSEPLLLDLIWTRFSPDFARKGGFQVRIESKPSENRVPDPGEGFRGGRARGRSGWEGSVAPRKVLTLHLKPGHLKMAFSSARCHPDPVELPYTEQWELTCRVRISQRNPRGESEFQSDIPILDVPF